MKHGKYIAMVDNLVGKAMGQNGKEFKVSSYNAIAVDGVLTLTHYGTVILKYDIQKDIVLKWGGFSMSDANALNTVLDRMGYQYGYFHTRGGQLNFEDNSDKAYKNVA